MAHSVIKRVFRHVRYRVGAAGVAFMALSAALLLPNFSVLSQIFLSNSISLKVKISFLLSLYGSLFTNFTFWSASYLILVAVLFGINVALLTFYIRRRQEVSGDKTAHVASLGGMISAVLGIGCAACGSVVVTAVLGLFGGGGLLLLLPLKGAEFGILGVLLLLFSIRYLIKRIKDPLVCPVKLSSPSVD